VSALFVRPPLLPLTAPKVVPGIYSRRKASPISGTHHWIIGSERRQCFARIEEDCRRVTWIDATTREEIRSARRNADDIVIEGVLIERLCIPELRMPEGL